MTTKIIGSQTPVVVPEVGTYIELGYIQDCGTNYCKNF